MCIRDRVIVATDDQRIADAVRAFGGAVQMTRADHRTGTDRLAEIAATLTCDIVVKVVRNASGEALYFSRSPIPFWRSSPDEGGQHALKHMGLYAYRRTFVG